MRKSKYSLDVMATAVKSVKSIRALLRYFSLKETGGNYSYMSMLIKKHDLDTSHFHGQGWAKGQTKHNNNAIATVSAKNSLTESIILSLHPPHTTCKKKLRKIVMKYKPYTCEVCDMPPTWIGKPLTLHLDHKNGDNHDNRIENLRFLCPNCHQQTPTWGRSTSSPMTA